MSWIRRLANLVRSNRHARDLDRELAFHLQERVDDLVAAGMTPERARVEARRRFGNYGVQKENTRDADVFQWLDSVIDDVRYAARMLRNSPAFAVVAIVSLALGIGANTAIFTLINAVILRSLPVTHPEQLVRVVMGKDQGTFTNPIWEQIRDQQTVFTGAFAFSGQRFNLAASGPVRNAFGSLVSGDYFQTLGVQPELGRLLTKADDQRGCPPIAVLSYGFWKTEYGGDPRVIGKTISLETHPFTIVGVAQPGFVGLDVGKATQLFAPLCADLVLRGPGSVLDRRSTWWLSVMARQQPGKPLTFAQNGLKAIAASVFDATVPANWRPNQQVEYRKSTLNAVPAANGLSDLRTQYKQALFILLVIVGLVLIIACANVANLLLARAAVRQREMAIRVALGAARRRVVRQLLTESLLLSLTGSLLGLLFARWGSRLLVAFLSPPGNPIFLDLVLDRTVLLFSIGVAVATGLAFGLSPAWRAARVAPNAALKANGRGVVEGQRRFTIGKALVIGQVAISLSLVVAAALLLGTFRNLSKLDAGFRTDDVLLVSVNQPGQRPSNAEATATNAALLSKLRSLPGVASASISQLTPLGNMSWNEEMLIDGFTPKSMDDGVAYFNEVSDGYFTTLGTPILAGRDFNNGDRVGAPLVAIINETMARHFYRSVNAIGRTFRYRVGNKTSEPYQIVGVVKDAKYQSLREKTLATAFIAMAQDSAPGAAIEVALRIPGGASAAAPGVKAAIAEVNPRLSMTTVTFATQVANSLTRERLLATLSAFFGALALALAMIGLYGVMSYTVARRKSEIGVRMALGAGQRRIASMVLSEVAAIIVVGFIAGIGLSLAATRFISSFLFGVKPTDASTFVASMLVLGTVAGLAAYLPARRASRVSPMEALREE